MRHCCSCSDNGISADNYDVEAFHNSCGLETSPAMRFWKGISSLKKVKGVLSRKFSQSKSNVFCSLYMLVKVRRRGVILTTVISIAWLCFVTLCCLHDYMYQIFGIVAVWLYVLQFPVALHGLCPVLRMLMLLLLLSL